MGHKHPRLRLGEGSSWPYSGSWLAFPVLLTRARRIALYRAMIRVRVTSIQEREARGGKLVWGEQGFSRLGWAAVSCVLFPPLRLRAFIFEAFQSLHAEVFDEPQPAWGPWVDTIS